MGARSHKPGGPALRLLTIIEKKYRVQLPDTTPNPVPYTSNLEPYTPNPKPISPGTDRPNEPKRPDRPERVAVILKSLADKKAKAYMSVIHWGEIYYNTMREQGTETAEQVIEQLSQYPIELVNADRI